MKKVLSLVFLTLMAFSSARATHIVGGELELTHIENFTYQLSLYIYFDEVNGNEGAKDPTATVFLFQKSSDPLVSDLFMDAHVLELTSDVLVEYTNPECSNASLQTSRLLYTRQIELDPSRYNAPQGYYATYHRCCRNDIIQNIVAPNATGQGFYLEFPAVLKNGLFFQNSSPNLFPPLSDFACIDRAFYFDFAGSDLDGDSLVYSLSVPLAGYSSQDDPAPANPLPGPYREVDFAERYDLQDMILGNPSLTIDPEGFITITPSELGLFVFAIKCEEFRDGEKIGEVRRDYQMFVIDCPAQDPPQIGEVTDAVGSPVVPGETLVFDVNDEEEETCIEVTVSDPNETLFFARIEPVNFEGGLDVITVSDPPSSPLAAGEEFTFEVCLNTCTPLENERVYDFLLLIGDESCALPLLDTIPLSFQAINNNLAPVAAPDERLIFNELNNRYQALMTANIPFRFSLFSNDSNPETSDSLAVAITETSFPREWLNTDFIGFSGRDSLTTDIVFTPNCDLASGSEITHTMTLSVQEIKCGNQPVAQFDIPIVFNVFRVGTNQPPKFSRSILADFEVESSVDSVFQEVTVGETFIYEIAAEDSFTDSVQIFMNAPALGSTASLEFASEKSRQFAEGRFVFNPTCDALGEGFAPNQYIVDFIALDDPIGSTSCGMVETDTLRLFLNVKDIEQPELGPFPNVFTPNGDAFNNEYTIPNLPLDDCQDEFVGFQLFNRWGDEIFITDTRNFSWSAEGYPPGVYFYIVRYRKKSYKGSLTLLGDTP